MLLVHQQCLTQHPNRFICLPSPWLDYLAAGDGCCGSQPWQAGSSAVEHAEALDKPFLVAPGGRLGAVTEFPVLLCSPESISPTMACVIPTQYVLLPVTPVSPLAWLSRTCLCTSFCAVFVLLSYPRRRLTSRVFRKLPKHDSFLAKEIWSVVMWSY